MIYELGDAATMVAAGLSIIKIQRDGSKRPDGRWKARQHAAISLSEAGKWDHLNRSYNAIGFPGFGLGVVCGVVSGGLEVLDFDDSSCYGPWSQRVTGILSQLPVIETPSGGYHVYFRCEAVSGNTKIALTPDHQVRIETRGEGGFVCAPMGPVVHAAGRPYIQVAGPQFPAIPHISTGDREQLWLAAAEFDESQQWEPRPHRSHTPTQIRSKDDELPSDAFNRSADWAGVLEPAGWHSVDGIEWTRPGKSQGTSARVGTAKNGDELLMVFSSNAHPLWPNTQYSKFSVFALLYYDNDWTEAARAVRRTTQ